MNKIKKLFIPASESHSLRVHLTHGCLGGRCTFCPFQNHSQFIVNPHILVKEEINRSIDKFGTFRRAFILHGDSLSLPNSDLIDILKYLKTRNPFLESISILAKTSSIIEKNFDELSELSEHGLTRIYQPIISGSNEILHDLDVTISNEEQYIAAEKIKKTGLQLAQSIVLGTAEEDNLEMNAIITAKHLSNMKPNYISAVELTHILHTRFNPDFDLETFDAESALLSELITLIRNMENFKTVFHSTSTTEALSLRIELPTQRNYFIAMLEELLRSKTESGFLANFI